VAAAVDARRARPLLKIPLARVFDTATSFGLFVALIATGLGIYQFVKGSAGLILGTVVVVLGNAFGLFSIPHNARTVRLSMRKSRALKAYIKIDSRSDKQPLDARAIAVYKRMILEGPFEHASAAVFVLFEELAGPQALIDEVVHERSPVWPAFLYYRASFPTSDRPAQERKLFLERTFATAHPVWATVAACQLLDTLNMVADEERVRELTEWVKTEGDRGVAIECVYYKYAPNVKRPIVASAPSRPAETPRPAPVAPSAPMPRPSASGPAHSGLAPWQGRGKMMLSVLWALLPIVSLGILTPIPFAYAAVKLRNRKLWLISAAYGFTSLALWILLTISDSRSWKPTHGIMLAILYAVALLATFHAFRLRHRVFTLPSPPRTKAQEELARKDQARKGREEQARRAREGKAERQAREKAERQARPESLFKGKATKRFFLSFHQHCDLTITTAGIEFADYQDSKYSFTISSSQLRNASIRNAYLSNTDLILRLTTGQKYNIELNTEFDRELVKEAISRLLFLVS